MTDQRRILFIFSDTGGGHRSAVEAIIEAIRQIRPDPPETSLLDFFTCCTPFPLNRAGPLYGPWVNYAAWSWGFGWHLTDNPKMARLVSGLLDRIARPALIDRLKATAPNLVVCDHPLAVCTALHATRAACPGIPYISVITDLGNPHLAWFYPPEVDFCIVPTVSAVERARRMGVPEEKLAVVGLPVSLQFGPNSRPRRQVRADLDLNPDGVIVLVVGGGEGMGRVYPMARAIAQARLPVQIVVIAGRNRGLKSRLEEVGWEVPTRILGFVKNMPDWMRAADVIVTKAGPGTISEALIAGLPILLSGYVPGQEEGNVKLVVDGGAGRLTETPEALVSALRDLVENPDLRARMADAARQLGRPDASLAIARIILDHLDR
ncbi:MAG: hypothetical protein A2Z04_03760 [Chloroflexi bacterium RBG_16_57_9]|nr:MAG: hypothetical protein A2Z04_03760 [Chloroflexi bacterium RBG_16_57_9]